MTESPESHGLSYGLILAVIVPALLFILGWTYLHYYLSAFGISVSELDLDIQTILIYSLTPLRIITWPVAIAFVFFLCLATALVPWAGRAIRRDRGNVAASVSTIRHAWIPVIATVLVVLILLPAVNALAKDAVRNRWKAGASPIVASFKQPDGDQFAQWASNYRLCADRRALGLVFADKSAFYMLCASTTDSSGLVFEVRRDLNLTSVRFVSKP